MNVKTGNGRRTCLVAGALAIGLGGLAACGRGDDQRPAGESDAAAGVRPLQRFYDYRLIETDVGVRQWVLESAEMLKFGGQDDVQLLTVHMDFFRDGDHFSVLTSDSGRANLQTHDVHVWGDVIVVTDDGRRLETEQLFFDNKTERITNEVYNRFTRDGDVLEGIGLEATPDLEYIEIKQKVEAEVVEEPTQEPERESDER